MGLLHKSHSPQQGRRTANGNERSVDSVFPHELAINSHLANKDAHYLAKPGRIEKPVKFDTSST